MKNSKKSAKAAWSAPVVVDLDKSAGDVANGYAVGTDGAGGYTTSMS